jgi:hypothetical protein
MATKSPAPPYGPDPAFDLGGKIEQPHAYIQWKGTDVCMDFHCDCGAHLHFDGDFAYAVKCPHCKTAWEMPSHVFPRRLLPGTFAAKWHEPLLMAPDEDLEPDGDMDPASAP